MTFDDILDQAIEMLQRRGRLTYRTLKLQFNLDDEYLDALREEILYSQPQVVDDEGKGLIWTGESEIQPEPVSPSQPTETSEQPSTQQDQPTQAEPPPIAPSTPNAERRQITVMFSDLVDSTKLSGQLDPEDYREVLRAYQSTCSEVIHRFDGYIAQHLGDALLVYFGYPQAHENDAHRGILAGLGMLEAMKALNTRLEQEKGIRLSIRVGIHTGLTVISDVGSGQKHEMLALGETPNVASRIQGIAEPDTIAISEATYRLVQGYFDCDDFGLHTLKGVAEPVQVYRVLQESGAQSRFEIVATRGLTPLVGREQEVGLLLDRWNQVKDGQGQVVLLSGEGGIGKSRLVQVVKDHVANEPHMRWECRSSPYYQNTALYPMTDLFQRTLQFQSDDTPKQRLEKLEQTLSQYRLPLEESAPLFASLLSLLVPEDRYPPLNLSPQRQRQKTLESILAIMLELAEQQPMLFILEDVHWTDPTTLEFVDLLIDQTPTASILTLLTCRPTFQPTWSSRSYLTQVTLNRLSRNQIERIATQVAGGKSLPAEVLQQIIGKTDGVPLYVEECTKAVLESGLLKETDAHYELTGSLPSMAIPATLQDSLMSRLDRLMTGKVIAQLGATIGRQFSYELLHAVSQLDEPTLQRELGRLVEAELVYPRGLLPQATYTFKHALIQDAAYQSLLKSTRQQYHQLIGHVLEERFPETIETQPELLAHHYTEAGLNEQAIGYWQRAGEETIQRSANVEAIVHLTKGLELLRILPDTPERTQQELALRIALNPSLVATKGYAAPEVEHNHRRAQALCQQAGETPQLFQVLSGCRAFYLVRAELEAARELNEHMLRLAQDLHDPVCLLGAHNMLGHTLVHLGAFLPARAHLEEGVTRCASRHPRTQIPLTTHGQDPETFGLSWLAQALWVLGYPEQAVQRSNEALALAHERAHPFNLACVLEYGIRLNRWRGELQTVQEWSETRMTLSTAYGFAQHVAVGTIDRGRALIEQGHIEEGLALMHQGLAAYQATGALVRLPLFLAPLAEAQGKAGHVDEALTVCAEALAHVNRTGERWWESELHRLKGELLLKQPIPDENHAESCFHQALSIARNQQARSLELRAATSLSRLWQSQGKRDEALQVLAEVYEWFTEGFDTVDLIEAKSLLDELEDGR